MAELRNGIGPGGRGRPKGSQNKVAKAAKEAIEEAAHKLGGVDRLVAWAKEDPLNERAFWSTVYPKLLPLTTQVSGSMTIQWPLSRSKLEQ